MKAKMGISRKATKAERAAVKRSPCDLARIRSKQKSQAISSNTRRDGPIWRCRMTYIRDPGHSGQDSERQLQFGRYILDLDRGCLLLDGSEIALRPKTFAVLEYLLRNSSRLVAKDELFAAVWPNVAVTDDTLVQSIGELRRALGEDGSRFIKTIPRRGYRFECAHAALGQLAQPASDQRASSSYGTTEQRPEARAQRLPSVARLGRLRPALFIYTALALVPLFAIPWLVNTRALSEFFSSAANLGNRGGRNFAATQKPALAVLPFVNETGDARRDYFVDGLTQDVIGALGHFSSLTVMSWNAVLGYKAKAAQPGQLQRDLGVRYLVEGSFHRLDDRIQVAVQLIDTADGRLLWSGGFEEPLSEVFALQDKITRQIVQTLAVRVTQIEQRRAQAKPTAILAAYEDVLRARPVSQYPTRAKNVQARELLNKAIALDANYAATYAALAQTYYLDLSMGWAERPSETLNRAEQLAIKALSMDASEVRAHLILARIHILHKDYEAAKAEVDRAIEINPNDAQSVAGRGNILMWLGQTDAAIEALQQAQRIDPALDAMDRFALSLAYYLKGRYKEAGEQAELNLSANASADFSRAVLAATYAQQNRAQDAARVVADIRLKDPAFDPAEFGSKFLNANDLERLRDGLYKAGLYPDQGRLIPQAP